MCWLSLLEKHYLLEKEGHVVSVLYLNFMPSLAWAGPYHAFGYIIFFFFFWFFESGSAPQSPEMHCWEHSVHMLSVTDLSSLWKGPRLISVAHIRGLLGAQGHNCFDGNCFLNWSTVGKTAEKELFWIALLVKKKKKKERKTSVGIPLVFAFWGSMLQPPGPGT